MRTLRLTVAYHGAGFVGWQVQPNGPSIQEHLQLAWRRVTGEDVGIVGSGRTDAGVHALGQVCSVSTESSLDIETLCRALNANLPLTICVLCVQNAAAGFHAIRDARVKTYRYQVQYGCAQHVLLGGHYWFVRGPLDVAGMQAAARHLVGTHDFASFETTGSSRLSTVRTVHRLEVIPQSIDGYEAIWIEVTANGFLYNMVRSIVGTLVLIGRRRKPVDWMSDVLKACDRQRAGPTAPPHGLLLLRVDYGGTEAV